MRTLHKYRRFFPTDLQHRSSYWCFYKASSCPTALCDVVAIVLSSHPSGLYLGSFARKPSPLCRSYIVFESTLIEVQKVHSDLIDGQWADHPLSKDSILILLERQRRSGSALDRVQPLGVMSSSRRYRERRDEHRRKVELRVSSLSGCVDSCSPHFGKQLPKLNQLSYWTKLERLTSQKSSVI